MSYTEIIEKVLAVCRGLETNSNVPASQNTGAHTENIYTLICELMDEFGIILCCQCGEPVGSDGGFSPEGLPRCAKCIAEDEEEQ